MVADSIERYEDVEHFVRQSIEQDPNISHDMRVHLSHSFHERVVQYRNEIALLTDTLSQQTEEAKQEATKELISQIIKELFALCNNIIELTTDVLLPNADSPEVILFYYKLLGDYYRYLCEFANDDEKAGAIAKASECYTKALQQAEQTLPIAHPARLGLIVNMSVFIVVDEGKLEEGLEIATKTYRDAQESIDNGYSDDLDSVEIYMKMLKDNIDGWQQS